MSLTLLPSGAQLDPKPSFSWKKVEEPQARILEHPPPPCCCPWRHKVPEPLSHSRGRGGEETGASQCFALIELTPKDVNLPIPKSREVPTAFLCDVSNTSTTLKPPLLRPVSLCSDAEERLVPTQAFHHGSRMVPVCPRHSPRRGCSPPVFILHGRVLPHRLLWPRNVQPGDLALTQLWS